MGSLLGFSRPTLPPGHSEFPVMMLGVSPDQKGMLAPAFEVNGAVSYRQLPERKSAITFTCHLPAICLFVADS